MTPGTILLSGNVGYSSHKTETVPTSSTQGASNRSFQQQQFQLVPLAGVFVAERLAVGAVAALQQVKITEPEYTYGPGGQQFGVRTARNNNLQIGPFVRYYQMVGDKAAFYGQLSGGYAGGKSRTTWEGAMVGPNITTEASGGFAALQPGFVFFPSERLGLELTVGSVSYVTMRNELVEPQQVSGWADSRYTSFEARFGLTQLTLGASVYLGGK